MPSPLILGRRANLLGIGVQFRQQRFDIDAVAARLQLIEREHRLREQIDRGLTSAALEAQMKSGRDAIERDDESLAGVVGLGRGVLEQFGGGEVFAAIKLLDRRFQMRASRESSLRMRIQSFYFFDDAEFRLR